ncbi:MAG: M14 family metallocarboxypeptidase [Candidatus Poribacteria bacterium]|nr:M14 family metallocarboxypeptidase [Candidatus Poribacteria bacterium]
MRDYGEVVQRIQQNESAEIVGNADGFSIYSAEIGHADGFPRLLAIGGTHGDEPAGVEAALRILEAEPLLSTEARIQVLPCVNPYGYTRNERLNRAGIDLNWSFHCPELPEIAAVRRAIDGRRYDAVIDLHEDWESPGFYMYEVSRRGYIGEAVARAVSKVCPINQSAVIEGDAASGGILRPDPRAPRREARGYGIPIALYDLHTDLYITTETPTGAAMEIRVEAHLRAARAVLQELSKERAERKKGGDGGDR